jgi:hypothetical protein
MWNHIVPNPLHSKLSTIFDQRSHHVTLIDDNMRATNHRSILGIINSSVLSVYLMYSFPIDYRRGHPWVEKKYQSFTHFHQENTGLDINTRLMLIIWTIYKRLAFRKYSEENWLASTERRQHDLCMLWASYGSFVGSHQMACLFPCGCSGYYMMP